MTGTREIKKVAEARARKKKRAMNKLKVAKRQANMMAENSELSERQKIKVNNTSLPLFHRALQWYPTMTSQTILLCIYRPLRRL